MNIEKLLLALNENSVVYVVIGAWALPLHGYSRPTLDFDVFIRPTRVNAQRVLKALSQVGYDVSDLTVPGVLAKKTLFRDYPLNADIHPSVSGASFREVWKHRVLGTIGRVSTNFASLDDLIRMKEAAGRAKDKEDLKVLRRLRDRLHQSAGSAV